MWYYYYKEDYFFAGSGVDQLNTQTHDSTPTPPPSQIEITQGLMWDPALGDWITVDLGGSVNE